MNNKSLKTNQYCLKEISPPIFYYRLGGYIEGGCLMETASLFMFMRRLRSQADLAKII